MIDDKSSNNPHNLNLSLSCSFFLSFLEDKVGKYLDEFQFLVILVQLIDRIIGQERDRDKTIKVTKLTDTQMESNKIVDKLYGSDKTLKTLLIRSFLSVLRKLPSNQLCVFLHIFFQLTLIYPSINFYFIALHFIFSINLIYYLSLVRNNCQLLSFSPTNSYFFTHFLSFKTNNCQFFKYCAHLHCHLVLVLVFCQMSLQVFLSLSSPLINSSNESSTFSSF